jgi:hypothetical protein
MALAQTDPLAAAAAATEQPGDGGDERRVLLSLSDDSLHIIFAQLPLPAVAALAGACTQTCAISCAENLWQRLVQARWPGVTAAEGAGRWRVLHRERAALPRWQYLWCCMDAVERLLTERPAPVLTSSCARKRTRTRTCRAIGCRSRGVRTSPSPGRAVRT